MEHLYETFEHGADIGIRGYGKTLEEAFSNILKALFSLMTEDLDFTRLPTTKKYKIQIESDSLDELLVVYINKVLTIFALENVILKEFEGKIIFEGPKFKLEGYVKGDQFDPEKYGLGVEVKGATFTLAKVEKTSDGWVAQCVVDV